MNTDFLLHRCTLDIRLVLDSFNLHEVRVSSLSHSDTRVVGADKMITMSRHLNHDILEAGAVRDEIVPAARSEIWERQP